MFAEPVNPPTPSLTDRHVNRVAGGRCNKMGGCEPGRESSNDQSCRCHAQVASMDLAGNRFDRATKVKGTHHYSLDSSLDLINLCAKVLVLDVNTFETSGTSTTVAATLHPTVTARSLSTCRLVCRRINNRSKHSDRRLQGASAATHSCPRPTPCWDSARLRHKVRRGREASWAV